MHYSATAYEANNSVDKLTFWSVVVVVLLLLFRARLH
jgi:hypothetical protein